MRVNLRGTIETKAGSQCAFAKQAKINAIRLNRIVNGWIDPTPTERERFTELLGVDADWLFRMFTIPRAATEPPADELGAVADELRRIAGGR